MTLDFFIGLCVGAVLGAGGTWMVQRVRGWLGHSEISRLRTENRALKRRLTEKERHISRMLTETERLAERLGVMKVGKEVGKKEPD
jgi:predicted RNase H-like nuclease (RuvC/YqgF family)